ncbi:MAG: hypothetical protein ACRDY0_09310 [Acidimicrobiales bacterium]
MRPSVVLDAGRQHAGMSLADLWIAYVGVGGSATAPEMGALLAGTIEMSRFEYDMVAQAINDRFVEDSRDHPVPYFDDLVAS